MLRCFTWSSANQRWSIAEIQDRFLRHIMGRHQLVTRCCFVAFRNRNRFHAVTATRLYKHMCTRVQAHVHTCTCTLLCDINRSKLVLHYTFTSFDRLLACEVACELPRKIGRCAGWCRVYSNSAIFTTFTNSRNLTSGNGKAGQHMHDGTGKALDVSCTCVKVPHTGVDEVKC